MRFVDIRIARDLMCREQSEQLGVARIIKDNE
jgi:hypothetical protein